MSGAGQQTRHPVRTVPLRALPWLSCAALLVLAVPVNAADLNAATMGAVSDLLAHVSADRPPAGADPTVYRRAVEALKTEGLAGAARPPQPGDKLLFEAYKRALLLGPKADQLRDEIGRLHDAVRSGQEDAIASTISSIFGAAGRPAPKDGALAELVTAAQKAGGEAPAETVNEVIQRPGYTINITDAIAAATTTIEVTIPNGPGGKPARVVFEGEASTHAKPGGDGLDRRVEPGKTCTMSDAASAALRDKLNGDWVDGGGRPVSIAGSGNTISVTDTNPEGGERVYEGRYELGKIDVRHAITQPDDMGSGLPMQVREQLAKMGLAFTIRLETCADAAKLSGRWGSQHVTYSTDYHVTKVHDPYDLRLELSRRGTGREQTAEGAAVGEPL